MNSNYLSAFSQKLKSKVDLSDDQVNRSTQVTSPSVDDQRQDNRIVEFTNTVIPETCDKCDSNPIVICYRSFKNKLIWHPRIITQLCNPTIKNVFDRALQRIDSCEEKKADIWSTIGQVITDLHLFLTCPKCYEDVGGAAMPSTLRPKDSSSVQPVFVCQTCTRQTNYTILINQLPKFCIERCVSLCTTQEHMANLINKSHLASSGKINEYISAFFVAKAAEKLSNLTTKTPTKQADCNTATAYAPSAISPQMTNAIVATSNSHVSAATVGLASNEEKTTMPPTLTDQDYQIAPAHAMLYQHPMEVDLPCKNDLYYKVRSMIKVCPSFVSAISNDIGVVEAFYAALQKFIQKPSNASLLFDQAVSIAMPKMVCPCKSTTLNATACQATMKTHQKAVTGGFSRMVCADGTHRLSFAKLVPMLPISWIDDMMSLIAVEDQRKLLTLIFELDNNQLEALQRQGQFTSDSEAELDFDGLIAEDSPTLTAKAKTQQSVTQKKTFASLQQELQEKDRMILALRQDLAKEQQYRQSVEARLKALEASTRSESSNDALAAKVATLEAKLNLLTKKETNESIRAATSSKAVTQSISNQDNTPKQASTTTSHKTYLNAAVNNIDNKQKPITYALVSSVIRREPPKTYDPLAFIHVKGIRRCNISDFKAVLAAMGVSTQLIRDVSFIGDRVAELVVPQSSKDLLTQQLNQQPRDEAFKSIQLEVIHFDPLATDNFKRPNSNPMTSEDAQKAFSKRLESRIAKLTKAVQDRPQLYRLLNFYRSLRLQPASQSTANVTSNEQ